MATGLLLLGSGAGWFFLSHRPTGAVMPERAAPSAEAVVPVEEADTAEAALDVFPEPVLPEIVSERLIAVSLGLLEKNGADLRRPMPSVHRVLAATPQVGEAMAAWGKRHGFTPRPLEVFYEHGGEPRYAVELVRTAVPRPEEIHADGLAIFAATKERRGVFYQTWQGEIVR